jgi:hypothetical protein
MQILRLAGTCITYIIIYHFLTHMHLIARIYQWLVIYNRKPQTATAISPSRRLFLR